MTNDSESFKNLEERLERLLKKQELFSAEIKELQLELKKVSGISSIKAPESTSKSSEPIAQKAAVTITPPVQQPAPKKPVYTHIPKTAKKKTDMEKFIGENLINKIGIVVTIIGVVIGAKYSIEHDLVSPLTRIILGYLTGIGLLGFGIKLKKKYENFSAVLVSGAMVIMYFITFSAYNYYELFSQFIAFGLMVIFTAFTVIAALNYKQSVIAHIGLVGAYAVPFLLSNDSGRADILFSYVAIINIGILVISFKKYWKSLYFSAFIFTWLIYFSWYLFSYNQMEDFTLAIIFLSVFFGIFYITFLVYKLIKKEQFNIGDILLLLVNSFVFYGLGYAILKDHETGEQLLGVFTLVNAIIHFVVGLIIFKQKLGDKNLFYFVIGLVLVFLTVAIPVQLDGNWVTALWISEAALLFWIGRTKKVAVYEQLSYVLMALAVFSLVHDWFTFDSFSLYGENTDPTTPVLNVLFLTAVLFIMAFGFILYIHRLNKPNHKTQWNKVLYQIFSVIAPVALIIVIYIACRIELVRYFDQLFNASLVQISENGASFNTNTYNYDLRDFRIIWVHIYTMLFLSALMFLNLKKIKNTILSGVTMSISIIAILVFLVQGTMTLSALMNSYIDESASSYFDVGVSNIMIRYLAFAVLALLLWSLRSFISGTSVKKFFWVPFQIFQHFIILVLAGSELIHWMNMAGDTQSYKLGLSILWGIYALLLIVLGIWKRKTYLRITAIILFAITLVKLFFYDISHLNTLSKTVVFVSLGILLLVISFLYNKFKNKIANDPES